MRRMARIVVPVLVGIIIPLSVFIIQPLDPNRDGDGAMLASYFFIRIGLPIIFALCLFIQTMVVIPTWNKLIQIKRYRIVKIAGLMLATCLVIAGLLGYGMWQKQFGIQDFYISTLIVFAAMFLYMIGNISTLYLFDRKLLAHPELQA